MLRDRIPAIGMCDPYTRAEAALAKAVAHRDQIVFLNCLDLYHAGFDADPRERNKTETYICTSLIRNSTPP